MAAPDGKVLAQIDGAMRSASEAGDSSVSAFLRTRTVRVEVPVIDGGRPVGRLSLVSESSDLVGRLAEVLLIAAAGSVLAISIGLSSRNACSDRSRLLSSCSPSQKTVKILHYHNITPHEFFPVGSGLYQLCKEGRRQLAELLDKLDFFTGDSQYNVDELVTLGVPRSKTQVVSIIVETAMVASIARQNANPNVLFVGRIAENKRQDRIVEAYARLLQTAAD